MEASYLLALSWLMVLSSVFWTGQAKMWVEKWDNWCRWTKPLRVRTLFFQPPPPGPSAWGFNAHTLKSLLPVCFNLLLLVCHGLHGRYAALLSTPALCKEEKLKVLLLLLDNKLCPNLLGSCSKFSDILEQIEKCFRSYKTS